MMTTKISTDLNARLLAAESQLRLRVLIASRVSMANSWSPLVAG